jgi:hypothetical protein
MDDLAEEAVRTLLRGGRRPRHTLLTGWFSFPDGEATAGDVLAARRASAALDRAGLAHTTAWSPVFRPGAPTLEDTRPADCDALLFVCGPVHGARFTALHERFAGSLRVAAGVSVLDCEDPAVRGFHHVLPRDAPGEPARADLARLAHLGSRPPVVGVVLSQGQGEYGRRRRHDRVNAFLTDWLGRRDCARLPLETRLATDDWRLCATPEQLMALLGPCDLVVTTRLHGLVLGLRSGTPVIAVDPVEGGAKVSAQAGALRWPAVLDPTTLTDAALTRWWDWCLGRPEVGTGHEPRPDPDSARGPEPRG